MKWAVCISRRDAQSLGRLRLMPASLAQACAEDATVWVRGDNLTELIDLALRKLPGARRFEVVGENRIRPAGGRVCCGRLPDGPWAPLVDVLTVRPPSAALGGQAPPAVPIRLIRAESELPANALVTTLQTWADWSAAAPLVRLEPLAFAAAEDGRVLVCGVPLPPLAGQGLVVRFGVAVPCGLDWSPPVDAESLRALFGLAGRDLALLSSDGSCEVIPGEMFVAATRSAARLTAEGEEGAAHG